MEQVAVHLPSGVASCPEGHAVQKLAAPEQEEQEESQAGSEVSMWLLRREEVYPNLYKSCCPEVKRKSRQGRNRRIVRWLRSFQECNWHTAVAE